MATEAYCLRGYFTDLVCFREETEIIEGEVVEIQIDRPASGTVSSGWLCRHHVIFCLATFFGVSLGAIQMLRNAVGVSAFPEKGEMYGSTLLALRRGGWGPISRK